MNDQHYLYRYFDKDNVLLYIGISLNHMARLSQHKNYNHWYDEIASIKIQTFESRKKAILAEKKQLIKRIQYGILGIKEKNQYRNRKGE